MLKVDSKVIKMFMPSSGSEEWRGTVDHFQKIICGPDHDVWFKVIYTSGWWDWCLGSRVHAVGRMVLWQLDFFLNSDNYSHDARDKSSKDIFG